MAGAKVTHAASVSGEFDANSLTITYNDKERGERTIRLRDIFKTFHNCEVTLMIKESTDLPAVEDEGFNDDNG